MFALVFAVMAGFVGGATITAARSEVGLLAGTPAPAVSRAVEQGLGTQAIGGSSGSSARKPATRRQDASASPRATTSKESGPAGRNARLAAALRPLLGRSGGQLAAGVMDVVTGATASYQKGLSFQAAGVAAADILATLLVESQRSGTPVSSHDAQLATSAVEDGSAAAMTQLWQAVGGKSAIAAANKVLGLRATLPGSAGSWPGMTTTVGDQLRLLSDLSMSASPLTAANRDYALGLMTAGMPGQRWGVPAAATAGTRTAVADGSGQTGGLWDAASIGVIQRSGHVLLVVAMASHFRTQAAGIGLVQAAARAAAAQVTS